jgi:hypothetical protein
MFITFVNNSNSGIFDKWLSGNLRTVQLYVDGFCLFDIPRNCNKLMYQELLTNNCLGNVN